MLTHEQHQLVEHLVLTWARTHAKATVAMLSLMLLHRGPLWAGELKEALRTISGDTFDLDIQVVHRMLRRLQRLDLVQCTSHVSTGPGAARKLYTTTEAGLAVTKLHLAGTLAYLKSPEFTAAEQLLTDVPMPCCNCQCQAPNLGLTRQGRAI